MVLSYMVSKFPSKCLYNINLMKNNLPFGNINFQITNSVAYLNNLEVFEKKRGFGSYVLNNFETFVKNVHNVKRVNLLAWQPIGCDNVIKFFEKHGYFHIDPTLNTQTYDDSIMIYDLHKMSKLIQ